MCPADLAGCACAPTAGPALLAQIRRLAAVRAGLCLPATSCWAGRLHGRLPAGGTVPACQDRAACQMVERSCAARQGRLRKTLWEDLEMARRERPRVFALDRR